MVAKLFVKSDDPITHFLWFDSFVPGHKDFWGDHQRKNECWQDIAYRLAFAQKDPEHF
jgi:hypothetical protein